MNWLRLTLAHISRTRAEWIAALACLFGVVSVAAWQGYGLGAGLALLGLMVGGFLSVLIHELGHALCAKAVGWRVWIVSVLPVSVRLGHGPRFSTALRQDVGGFVLASPRIAAHETRWRSVLYTAGGPLASLIAGPTFIYGLTTFAPGSWETPVTAGLLAAALAFGVHSCMAALFTIWPHKSASGAPNDMMMILATLFSPAPPERERALAWGQALFAYGVEPSAWPEWIRNAAVAEASQRAPTAPELGFAQAIEAGEIARARLLAKRGEGTAEPVLRAFALAWFDQNADAADDALAGAPSRLETESLQRFRDLAIARIQALNGAHASAMRMLATFEADIAAAPTPHPFWEALLAHARQNPQK